MWFSFLSIGLLLQWFASTQALYEGCDNTYYLNPDSVAYLQSPYYPNKYPSGTSCRYKFFAPANYEILLDCSITIDKNPDSCSTEYLYVSTDGDSDLRGAEQFCGWGPLTRTTLFQSLVIAYVSAAESNSNVGGTFNCKLITRPQACDCGWSMSTRIVGGEEASKLEFPSMVGLYDTQSNFVFCGGTILNHRTIVTASHCTQLFPNPDTVLIIAGDHDLSSSMESQYATTYNVLKYIPHPNYDPVTEENDIALLITKNDIEWSRGVGPICLPFDQINNNFAFTNVNLLGWGTTSFAGARSSTLQKASVLILENQSCQKTYPALKTSQVCTYFQNRDACQFDSGGPVVYKGFVREYLLGIISYGFACGTSAGINTRVTSFADWISRNAVGSFCNKPFR